MTILSGIAVADGLCLLMIMAGYLVAGFMNEADKVTRLAIAQLSGLGLIVLGASAVGAVTPLNGASALLLWIPSLAMWLVGSVRRQFVRDVRDTIASPAFYPGLVGLLLLIGCLVLPYLIHPDLVIYDGKNNHDIFFWSVGAEYLQHHAYLDALTPNRDHPLYNAAVAIAGWTPAWGRMGAEGFLAVSAGAFGQSPVRFYYFAACSLAPAWLFSVLAIARQTGLPQLRRPLISLVCFCQPIFVYFVANGNFPNLLGALFSGGLWLITLLFCDVPRRRVWPLLAAGTLFTHGILCCYPEIFPFALAPVVLFLAWQRFRNPPFAGGSSLAMAISVTAGLCLNPVSTIRAWAGFWHSIHSARQDTDWVDAFARLEWTEYASSTITLAMPGMHLLGVIGGVLASACVLASFVFVIRVPGRAATLLLSLSGFFALLTYTLVTSFNYGWQKSVQFAAIPLAAVFPLLLAGAAQNSFLKLSGGWLRRITLASTLALMVYGMFTHAADILKYSGEKGVTAPLLKLGEQIARESPGQTVTVDGATFREVFFHSMWSAYIFGHNPLVFLSNQERTGGYLRDSLRLAGPSVPKPNSLYYVDAGWARAFDYNPESLVSDRVGALVRQHNLVTGMTGFARLTGLPDWTDANFALTIQPYADGWLEIALTPNGTSDPACKLHGTVSTPSGTIRIEAALNESNRLVARFPIKAEMANRIAVRIEGGPPMNDNDGQTRHPFRVRWIQSGR